LFVNLPVSLLPDINGPTLLEPLFDFKNYQADSNSESKPIVLILEDADSVLSPRMMDNINQVHTLLNLGDGLVGQALNLRVIATTNQKQREFDPALVRPGRLCTLQEFPLLTPEQAERCFKNLAPEREIPNFSKPVSLAQIYKDISHEDGNVINRNNNASVGFRVN
ncbi:MAG: AAA family ATPase, partial [Candidatus Nitrosothermus koennekii]